MFFAHHVSTQTRVWALDDKKCRVPLAAVPLFPISSFSSSSFIKMLSGFNLIVIIDLIKTHVRRQQDLYLQAD